jgi:hypothetical protein
MPVSGDLLHIETTARGRLRTIPMLFANNWQKLSKLRFQLYVMITSEENKK